MEGGGIEKQTNEQNEEAKNVMTQDS